MQRKFFQVLILTIPILVLLAFALKLANGSFAYTLDDPYIHLALAKHIWQGHYGINSLEVSAPSSSIIWPFLMAPFAAFPDIFEYIPFIFNSVCTIMSGIVLLNIFRSQNYIAATAIAFFLMLSMNVYGLIFTGMEHSLQILLVIYIAFSLLKADSTDSNKPLSLLFFFCVCILPLVRYEGLAITIPTLLYVFIKGKQKEALLSLTLVIVSLFSFSLFLYGNDLGFLPSSVLAKSTHANASSTLQNLMSNIKKYGFMLIPIGMIIISKLKANLPFAIMLALVTILHFIFGRHGWFGRYEVYFVLFTLVISLKLLTDVRPNMWFLVFIFPLPFANLIKTTLQTPLAASNIHNQQIQMGEIAALLNERIAVNDLGVVALRSKQYVLDLAGLGSLEALKHLQKSGINSRWVSSLMEDKMVTHAIVYADLFPKPPANWIKVAELKLLQEKITPAYDTVTFYSTTEEAAMRMRHAIENFNKMNRPGEFMLQLSSPP